MKAEAAKPSQQKRMTCWNCPRYDRAAFQCKDGKTNPRKKADTILVAELLGLRALCHYSLYRDAIARRMYFPKDPLTIDASARTVRRRRLIGIEPDIAADYKDVSV